MRRQIDLVKKCVSRSWTAFQGAFTHNKSAIDPEPVF